jgi:hypothetical protein
LQEMMNGMQLMMKHIAKKLDVEEIDDAVSEI